MPRILTDRRDPAKQALGNHLRQLQVDNPEELARLIASLSPEEAEEIQYDQEIWLRDSQWIDLSEENNASIIMYLAGRGAGKMVGHLTPILTPDRGFIPIKDLVVGDRIFDEQGKSTTVVATYDGVPEKAYRFHFTDGTFIDSCSEHQWVTWTHRDRKQYLRNPENNSLDFPEDWAAFKGDILNCHHTVMGHYGPEVRTSQDIVDTFYQKTKRGDVNHCIPLTKPVKLPEKTQIVDPYLLGYWLGDGSSGCSDFTCDPKDRENLVNHLEAAGYTVGNNNCYKTVSALRFITDLKKLGADTANITKKIPDEYLYGSIEQRLAFLQGLMDSDGTANKGKSTVEFCAKRKEHAEAVLWLARSLGERPVMKESKATLYGKDCGLRYRVTWRPKINPFRLPRKAALIKPLDSQAFRHRHRMITHYEEIEPMPMRCLTVDSPNSLFLIGEGLIPTHNTYTGASTLKRAVEEHGLTKILLLAYTSRDIRATLVPAIIGSYPPNHPNTPKWRPGEATLVWPNGAEAVCIPSEAGEDAPRGLNTEIILCDELASYGRNEGIIDQALLTLRHAPSKLIIMTTPKATPKIIEYVQRHEDGDNNIQLITGSTYDNRANLSKAFMEGIVSKYEGTSMAQQELHGKLILSNPSALWQMDTINRNLVKDKEFPRFIEICLGADPAILSRKSNVGKKTGRTPDKCGLMLSGLGEDGNIYTMENYSGSFSPEQMVDKICQIHDTYSGMAGKFTIVVEVNTIGEETLKMMFRNKNRLDVYKTVKPYFSTVSKLARAQPYALMSEQDKIKFADKASMSPLFTELSSFTGDGKSPDLMDSAVFSWSGLAPLKKSSTRSFELLM